MSEPLFNFNADFGSSYDGLIRRSIPGYDAIFIMALAILQQTLGESAKLLIVGSGTGMEIISFGSRQPGWHFTGVDLAEQMIQISRERIAKLGFAERVQLQVGSVADLPTDPVYDAATLILVLHFVPAEADKLALLKEVVRRLKPGGRLIFVTWSGDPASADFQEHLLPTMKTFQKLMGMPPEQAEAIWQKGIETGQLVPESNLLELLKHAGFESIEPFYRGLLASGWVARLP